MPTIPRATEPIIMEVEEEELVKELASPKSPPSSVELDLTDG
jgi:hypothetical protein